MLSSYYRCSPNIAHWALEEDVPLPGLPLCRNSCDDWFDACADDLSCAVNWITDWIDVNGVRVCNEEAKCRKFR